MDIAVKKGKYSLGEAKRQMDKSRFRTRVNLVFGLRPRSSRGEAGDEEQSGIDQLYVGQVGFQHQWLAC